MHPSDHLDAVFGALADPTRRAILAHLTAGDATVNALAAPFDVSLPAISKHLKVLEKAGLISRARAAQMRPCHLEPEALREVSAWAEQYRAFWQQSFDRLDAYLIELQTTKKIERKKTFEKKKKKKKNGKKDNR